MPPVTDTQTDYAAYRRVVGDSFRQWYDEGRDSWTGAETNDHVTRFVLDCAPPAAGRRRRALDVGSGRGVESAALAQGLDADVVALDLLDVHDTPPPSRGRVRFQQGDFLDFTDGDLDLIVDNGCLHHQRRQDWPGWAAHGKELLRPGGILVVSIFLSPDGDITAHPLDDGRLNWWLTEESVTALFTGAGLTPCSRTVIDRDFTYQGHQLKYLALSFRND
ncbi:class I SAM-dependent methyltransferase [Streptomyces sp. NPDC051956]|uniref:class I SAM-dependent methyltransferase n=1 Tax=Streptomyces sp. NPDC051956 TaxID=3365677 RepID=UPI0037D3056B